MLRRAIPFSAYRAEAPKLSGPLVFPQWGPMIALGAYARIQAQAGHMAIVQSAGPGQFLVTVVPETWRHQTQIAGVDGEYGFAALVIPAAVTATRVLGQRIRSRQQAQQPAPYLLPGPIVPAQQLPMLQAQGQAVQPCWPPLPAPAFMDAQMAGDLGLEIGCDGRPCGCGK